MIAICAIFKDEAKYIKDWILFHHLQGFDTFYLYDNESTDSYRPELEKAKKLAPKININLYSLPNGKSKKTYWFKNSPQHKAYIDCLGKCRDERWCLFLDIDEYAYCPNDRMEDFLKNYEDSNIAGIGINWILYGSSGHKKYSKDPVIQRFTKRDALVNQHIKTIIRPSKCPFQVQSPHFLKPSGKFRIVNEKKETLTSSLSPQHLISAEKIRINHYFTKSEEEFKEKLRRGRADTHQKRTIREFIPHDTNNIEDISAITALKHDTPSTITVYTSICNNYDSARNDIKVFYDSPSDKFKLPNLNAKIYKVLSHEFIKSDFSIWVDGNIYSNVGPKQLIDEFLADNDIVVFEHPHRKCIYKEYEEAKKRIPKEHIPLIEEQVSVYKQDGMPKDFGLTESGVIIRRHNNIVTEFNEKWWAEICRYHNRDQMSFPYVWWKMKDRIKIKTIRGNVRKHKYFRYLPHS